MARAKDIGRRSYKFSLATTNRSARRCARLLRLRITSRTEPHTHRAARRECGKETDPGTTSVFLPEDVRVFGFRFVPALGDVPRGGLSRISVITRSPVRLLAGTVRPSKPAVHTHSSLFRAHEPKAVASQESFGVFFSPGFSGDNLTRKCATECHDTARARVCMCCAG